jgi:hypothetical protein
MRGSMTARGLPRILLTAFALSCAGTLLHARQSPALQRPPVVRSDQVIKSKVELVTSDVIVRDPRGTFVHDLKKEDFNVREDGIKQQVVTLTLSRGGRIFNLASAPATAKEGVVLPPSPGPRGAPGAYFSSSSTTCTSISSTPAASAPC